MKLFLVERPKSRYANALYFSEYDKLIENMNKIYF